MTEEQRSLMGYKSKIHEQGDFENPNEGKPQLTEFDEYIFRLKSFPKVKTFPQVKEKKDGTRIKIDVDKAICEFEEEITHNVVVVFFRIDSLNFPEDEQYESAVIRFFKKIKTPLVEGDSPEWDRYFIVGMRFRGRVVVGKGQDKVPNGTYYLDVPTCRPILESDKHPDAVSAMQNELPGQEMSIETIKLLIKGSKNKDEGTIKLYEAKQSSNTVQVFLAAVRDGKISFPV
jgi:hypothetical protein